MANVKISELSASVALTGAEIVPIVQSSTTVRTTVQDIVDLAATASIDSSSLVTVSAFNAFTSSVVATSSFNQFTSSVITTSSFNAFTSSVVTTSSFNNFTSSYNTGSFTGSFTGKFIGAGGSNTEIQFNSGSEFSGNSSFRYIYTSGSLEQGNQVTASGEFSHAQGTLYNSLFGDQLTEAIGYGSHAEGAGTVAIGTGSHAEGGAVEGMLLVTRTQAIGNYSHAEGAGTIASGSYSHAEGYRTQAIGNYSHAAGYFTVASGSYQSVVGQYNVSSSTESAFIIGNGADGNNRSNLIFAAGNTVQITGSLSITGSGTINNENIATATPLTTWEITSGSFRSFNDYEFFSGSITWQKTGNIVHCSAYILVDKTGSGIDAFYINLDSGSLPKPYGIKLSLYTDLTSFIPAIIVASSSAETLIPILGPTASIAQCSVLGTGNPVDNSVRFSNYTEELGSGSYRFYGTFCYPTLD